MPFLIRVGSLRSGRGSNGDPGEKKQVSEDDVRDRSSCKEEPGALEKGVGPGKQGSGGGCGRSRESVSMWPPACRG